MWRRQASVLRLFCSLTSCSVCSQLQPQPPPPNPRPPLEASLLKYTWSSIAASSGYASSDISGLASTSRCQGSTPTLAQPWKARQATVKSDCFHPYSHFHQNL